MIIDTNDIGMKQNPEGVIRFYHRHEWNKTPKG